MRAAARTAAQRTPVSSLTLHRGSPATRQSLMLRRRSGLLRGAGSSCQRRRQALCAAPMKAATILRTIAFSWLELSGLSHLTLPCAVHAHDVGDELASCQSMSLTMMDQRYGEGGPARAASWGRGRCCDGSDRSSASTSWLARSPNARPAGCVRFGLCGEAAARLGWTTGGAR